MVVNKGNITQNVMFHYFTFSIDMLVFKITPMIVGLRRKNGLKPVYYNCLSVCCTWYVQKCNQIGLFLKLNSSQTV